MSAMLTRDALAYFGGNRTALATALKIRPESTYDWGERVPDLRQLQLELYSDGELQAEERLKPGAPRRQLDVSGPFAALLGLLKPEEREAVAAAMASSSDIAVKTIEALDVDLEVRTQLLEAARRESGDVA